jgi:hypothetical protein
MMWNFWPWQHTERERELEAKVATLKAKFYASKMREESLALVVEQQRLYLMTAVAVAKNGALAQGVPPEFFDKVMEARPPSGPYEQAAVGQVAAARNRTMNGYMEQQ